MAAITLYLTNSLASVHQALSETSPGADATTSPNYGWTVGLLATGQYSKANSQVEQATTTFATSPLEPDGSIDTTVGDCWRSENRYNGSFASANWTATMTVIAVTSQGGQDGNAGFRLFRGNAENGSDAVEITGARQEGGTVTDLLTSAQQSSTATFNPGAFTLFNEFLFIQTGWEITGSASGHGNHDVIMRVGSTASLIVTADFTPYGNPHFPFMMSPAA